MKIKYKENTDLNLIDVFISIWEGKIKIIAISIISFALANIYFNYNTDEKAFNATTYITPLSILDSKKYILLNKSYTDDVQFIDEEELQYTELHYISQISKDSLLNMFLELLNDRKLLKKAIRKFSLLDANNYSNDLMYDDAIVHLASSIKITTPVNLSEKNKMKIGLKKEQASYPSIEFSYNNSTKWKKALSYINQEANEILRIKLLAIYNSSLMYKERKINYQIEDITIKIDNLITEYDRTTNDQILYLKEQSQIAKKLKIVKNTLETQSFGASNVFLGNILSETPLYLRGYEAIDKEIELIRSRENKTAFVKGLFNLEKTKKRLMQDKTIARLRLNLSESPLSDKDDFLAANIEASATSFVYANYRKYLVLATAFGLVLGIIYVLFSSVLLSKKVAKKKYTN